jgi:hypothetical protein
MALHINLLHEEILEQRQRQRDPLKIGMMVLGALGAILFIYYMWNAYRTLEIRTRLNAVQKDWSKVETNVTTAQKRSAELTSTIGTIKILDGMIDTRFFWAPFLEKLARCVAPNAQVTNLDGTFAEDNKAVSVMIEGMASGREPRAAAEELRQLLIEQLSQSYKDVKVEFKSLEDLDTIANISGTNMPMARFGLSVNLTPAPPAPKSTNAVPTRAPKK